MAGRICQGTGRKENVMLPAAKDLLRQQIRARGKQISPPERTAGAGQICQRLMELDFWKQAATVLLYAPLPDEVDISVLLRDALSQGKQVALPRYDSFSNRYGAAQIVSLESDFSIGAFGVREPSAQCREIPTSQIDLALVPGIGFDLLGNRLGRGKGFYDRLLEGFAGIKCGIALDEQITGAIPTDKHDIQMDVLVTPTRLIKREGTLSAK